MYTQTGLKSFAPAPVIVDPLYLKMNRDKLIGNTYTGLSSCGPYLPTCMCRGVSYLKHVTMNCPLVLPAAHEGSGNDTHHYASCTRNLSLRRKGDLFEGQTWAALHCRPLSPEPSAASPSHTEHIRKGQLSPGYMEGNKWTQFRVWKKNTSLH